MLHTFLSFIIIFFIIYGIEGFGVSPNDLYVRVNDSFTISCAVNTADGELNFYDNDSMVPRSNIKRVNGTYIEMTIMYNKPVKKNLTCRQNRNNVGISEVIVDERMAPVVGFKCRTRDLIKILCVFKKPFAYLPIKYRFSFAMNDEKSFQSSLKIDGIGGYSSNIIVPATAQKLDQISFRFNIQASNKFYDREEKFETNFLEMLIPKEVENLQVMNELTTHSTAFVKFSLPKELSKVSNKITFDIRLKLAFDKKATWKKIENPRLQMTAAEGLLAIDNLEYANTAYATKIRMKAKIADDVVEMWSAYKEVSFKTKAKLPETPPSTCSNCFNILDNGNVVIYWMPVSAHFQNADQFSYLVCGWNEKGEEVIRQSLSGNSMVLESSLEARSLRIEVFSQNSEGISRNSSQLQIPLKRLPSQKKSLKIHKELVDEHYKISWKQLERLEVENFTIFWCHQRNDLPNQCDGPIHFQNVASNVTEFKIEALKSYQFGVATNFQNKSIVHGFQWAECTAAKSNEIGQVHSMWKNVASERSITIHWKVNCVDEPIVAGYNITYCLLDDNDPGNCGEPAISEIVILTEGDETNQYSITNLKSYRVYNVSVALMSQTRLGNFKEPITVRTLESAPTAPRNLQAVKINQYSIYLTWDRPIEVNGESMTYQLWYNDQQININDNNTMEQTFAYELKHLESFSNYTITVVACTSDCSDSSDSLTLRTAMSKPGAMWQPSLKKIENEEKVVINWEEPKALGGNLDYYQLKLVMSNEEKNYRVNGKVKSCIIKDFECMEDDVKFLVRAVNIGQETSTVLWKNVVNQTISCLAVPDSMNANEGELLYGEWSQPLTFYCHIGYSIKSVGLIIIIFIFLLIFVCMIFKFYQKFQRMKDIHITWPSGLDPSKPILTSSKSFFNGTKNLDLIKGHVLTDVEEEEEEEKEEHEDVEKMYPKPKLEVLIDSQEPCSQMRQSSKSEIFLPFICNPKTNEISYDVPKKSVGIDKAKSAPSTPLKNTNSCTELLNDLELDVNTGYMKMTSPVRSKSESSTCVEGYLDMSGKSLPNKSLNPKESDYLVHEIKTFIHESELHNNGYIGKRASFLTDSCSKHPAANMNANGYVGLPKHFTHTRRKNCIPEMMFALILLCSCITFTESSADGWIDPPEPIIKLRGSDIRIRCGVNGNKYSSSELWFFNNSNPVDAQYVKVINVSAIEMLLPNAGEQESVIVCKLNGQHGISYNDIKIGRRPDNISALKCISHNWHDMNCSFEKPYNPVAVHYSMRYRIAGSSQIYPCNQPAVKDPKLFWCHIPNNVYRRANPTFEFLLSGVNALGTLDQIIPIDNYASVIPSAPGNFKDLKIMSDGVILSWNVNSNLLVFPKPFDYEFLIVSPTECDPEPKRLRFTNLAAVDESDSPTNFTRHIDLKFVHTWYKIAIRMRISTAPDVEEMWSEWAKTEVKTVMRRPDHPPVVDTGSFNIGPGGDVYIYWKHLQKCYQNGVNYSYVIKSSNKQYEFPNEIHQQLAKYTKDRVNLMKDTTLTIRNINAMGASEKASSLVIPGMMRRLEGPSKIKKFLTNGSYQLSWSPPEHMPEQITSYTVFWCVSKSELPNSCDSSIDFVRRLPSETYFEYTSNETINFAVSANSQTSTSGMTWARCTTASSKEIGKIKTIWIPRLAAEEIEVEWKLECTDSGIVAGYQLEYCPSREPKTLECMEKEKKINITGGLDNPKHTLTGLTPYTTYKIIIRMFSNSTMGPESDPLANTTLEAAPSEVRGLIARNIGNTSVELYWDPPEYSNGVLLFYKVWANGKDHKVSEQDHTVEIDSAHVTRMNYTLVDLMAYREYDIAVEACTKECSMPTKTKIKTTIGAPGNFSRQPSIVTYRKNSMKNYTSATIGWEEPIFKGGELDYYEFRTKVTSVDDKTYEHIIKTRNINCFIEQLCTSNVMLYEFSVRAVNFVLTPHSKISQTIIEGSDERQNCDREDAVLARSLAALKLADPHGWTLPGPWSQAIGHSCHYGGLDARQNVFLMILVVASLALAMMFFYVYKKVKDMKDIGVQMPPGLEDLTGDKVKKCKDLGHMEKIPDILTNIDNVSINCEDENGQLLKKSLNGSLNGADCSSSLQSENTRSDMENEDEIEYGEFKNEKSKKTDNGSQSFIINPATGKVILPILESPELMPMSTPMSDKCPKPNIILNPKAAMASNGYVIQPPVKLISPMSPISSHGYVTHSMFNPMQSSGYTPLSAFGKSIISPSSAIDDKMNPKTPIVATTDQEGISGYVTHKQLSDFGQRMQ